MIDALPPGWPADVCPPENLAAMLAIEQIEVLAARSMPCPDCGFRVAVLWRGPHGAPPLWSCAACCATVSDDVPTPCRCGSYAFVDVPIHNGQSLRRDCAGCGRFLSFPVWYGQQVQDDQPADVNERERLRTLLLSEGHKRGWPSVRLSPWSTLQAGEEAWRKYLDYPAHGPADFRQLLDALDERTRHEAT